MQAIKDNTLTWAGHGHHTLASNNLKRHGGCTTQATAPTNTPSTMTWTSKTKVTAIMTEAVSTSNPRNSGVTRLSAASARPSAIQK